MKSACATLFLLAVLISPVTAAAARLQVPADYATIQDAVNAATPGDQIRVGPGQWCGATITKRLELVAEGGATIIGCAAPAPALAGVLRIGFFLPSGAASGTSIRHFVFDGAGISNDNMDPLAFAVFARDANDVVLQQNLILGTIQSITATRGSGWTVSHNEIRGLSALTCDGFCGGGDGIVLQARPYPTPRVTNNSVTHNVITGQVPDTLNEFSMVGVLVIGGDGTLITNNRISIPDNPVAEGSGQAIVVTNQCCGGGTASLTSINSVILNNDGRSSEFAVVIELESGGGTGNSAGTVLRGNLGVNDINGSATTVKNRSVKTLVVFP